MHQKKTIINGEELFGDFLRVSELLNSEDSFEIDWRWPDGVGNGFVHLINFKTGLLLGIGYHQVWENLTVSFDVKSSPFVHIGFGVSGSAPVNISYEQDKKDVIIIKSGQSYISYVPECRGLTEYPARTPICAVSIYIDTILLNKIMRNQHHQMPAGMRDILEGVNEKRHYYHSSNMTPAMNVAIHQILNCPYCGPLKYLYLESKALELITHRLAQVVSPESILKNSFVLRPDDIDRIHHAREIMSRDLENPPTLFKLARLVGLTHTKLNRGFREIYGTTVFGYLHQIRLEQAKLLLEEQRMNVTEVAFTVGYNSLPSFSTAFSKHFGLNPMTCIKNSPHTCLL